MTNRRREDDDKDPSFEGVTDYATVPPPAGDVHNARTAVAHLPDSFLDELRASKQNDAASTRRAKKFELPGGGFGDEATTRPGAQNPLAQPSPAAEPAKIESLVSAVNAALAMAVPPPDGASPAGAGSDGAFPYQAHHGQDGHARASDLASGASDAAAASQSRDSFGAGAERSSTAGPTVPPASYASAPRGRSVRPALLAVAAFVSVFSLVVWALTRYGHLLHFLQR
jgi:hypothetical protein